MKKVWTSTPFYNLGVLIPDLSTLEASAQKMANIGFEKSLYLPYNAHPVDNIFSEAFSQISGHYDMAIPLMKEDRNQNIQHIFPFTKYPQSLAIFHHLLAKQPPIDVLYQAMMKAKDHDLLYISSPDHAELHPGGEMHEGLASFKLGLRGIPAISEEMIVARDIELARTTGARLHFLQISTQRSVDLIAKAKSEGLVVSAGVSLGHLLFNHEHCLSFRTEYKFSPPLREEVDRLALIAAIKNKTIEVINIGLFPAKKLYSNFTDAPFTSLPLESFLSSLIEKLHKKHAVSLKLLEEVLAINPRKILKLPASGENIQIDINEFKIIEKGS